MKPSSEHRFVPIGERIFEVLREAYPNALSAGDIAVLVDCSPAAVRRLLQSNKQVREVADGHFKAVVDRDHQLSLSFDQEAAGE